MGVGLVAALATVFLAVITVFGVTLFFIAILYKNRIYQFAWVNEMGIKTAQIRQAHDPDTFHAATISKQPYQCTAALRLLCICGRDHRGQIRTLQKSIKIVVIAKRLVKQLFMK